MFRLLFQEVVSKVNIQFFGLRANIQKIAGSTSSALGGVVLIVTALIVQRNGQNRVLAERAREGQVVAMWIGIDFVAICVHY